MEMIEMSTRERRRMTLMTRVMEKLLKLRVAAEIMQVTYRQAKRIWRRYREEGDAGLVRRGRERRPNGSERWPCTRSSTRGSGRCWRANIWRRITSSSLTMKRCGGGC